MVLIWFRLVNLIGEEFGVEHSVFFSFQFPLFLARILKKLSDCKIQSTLKFQCTGNSKNRNF